ncbi:MAG: aromatic amino acid lyase [Planctomycetota bacterium]|nr:aromatic amino acid lyase [Planctomycetota bacterium]
MTDGAGGSVVLDGSSLTPAALVRLARDPRIQVDCDPAALDRVRRGREQIETIVSRYREAFAQYEKTRDEKDRPAMTYGVTTGFGEFRHTPISPDELEALQKNILLSHAVGVGDNTDPDDPANWFPADVIRAVMALRLNAFLKGHSGVRLELVALIARILNAGVISVVPTRGSVGSSGDLCPLAHLFGVLVGAGRFYVVSDSAEMGRRPPTPRSATELSDAIDAAVPQPAYKEGLALTNGTAFSTALLALSVYDAEDLANAADVAAAMSLEAACGRARALDPLVHEARGQAGQIDSAANLRNLLRGSEMVDRSRDVQDAYSLRCAPQVHGASRDTIAYAKMIVHREINAATDNPLFFPGESSWDEQFASNRAGGGIDGGAFSAGNFHGQPVGIAADVLAIGVAELADISERRTQLLLDRNHSRNLPANLVPYRGVNSGYMLAQYCAASLVSENKVLAHPASVDSIPTAANNEDHVAMATFAGRKVGTVLANAQAVLAIELLVAAQALEWRVAMNRPPDSGLTRPDDSCESIASAKARMTEFAEATGPGKRKAIADALGCGTAAAYLAVRSAAEPMVADRSIDGDIQAVRRLVEDGSILRSAGAALADGLRPIEPLQSAAS